MTVTRIFKENTPTHRWAKELRDEEVKGFKHVMLRLETHEELQELSMTMDGERGRSYDDLILMCLDSYRREQVMNDQAREPEDE